MTTFCLSIWCFACRFPIFVCRFGGSRGKSNKYVLNMYPMYPIYSFCPAFRCGAPGARPAQGGNLGFRPRSYRQVRNKCIDEVTKKCKSGVSESSRPFFEMQFISLIIARAVFFHNATKVLQRSSARPGSKDTKPTNCSGRRGLYCSGRRGLYDC